MTVRGESGTRIRARIVGTTFLPTPNDHDTVTLADGVLMPADQLARMGNGSFPQVVVRWRPGIDRTRAIAAVTRISGAPPIAPVRPPELDRLAQLDRLPTLLAGFLGLLGVISLAHGVVTNAVRRRRDLALLRTLGFRSREVAATIMSHACTLVIGGLVIGIPVGVVVGRITWRTIAEGVGIATDAAVQPGVLALVVAGALIVGLVIAGFPARAAIAVHPADALRSE